MNRLLFSLKTCQKSGAHFSEKKKAPAATCPEAQGSQKNLGPFFKNMLSRNRLNRLLIYPIMVTKKSIWSKSHSGYCFRIPLAWNLFEPAISGHSGQVRLPLCMFLLWANRFLSWMIESTSASPWSALCKQIPSPLHSTDGQLWCHHAKHG